MKSLRGGGTCSLMPDKLPNANVPNGECSPGPWRGGVGRGHLPLELGFWLRAHPGSCLSPPEGDIVRNLWASPVEEEGCRGCHSLSPHSDIGLFR